MEDYAQILQKVLTHSPYSQFKQYGEGEYRQDDNKNPYLSLTEVGLYDFKQDKQLKSLIQIAKELDILEPLEVKNNIDGIVSTILSNASEVQRYTKAYYQSRGIVLSDELIADIGFKYSDYNGTHQILNPIKNIKNEVVSVNKVFVDVSGNKREKKIQGSYKGDRCTCFGNRKSKNVYCFEGLEDAITHYTHIDSNGLYLVSYGCGNFKRLNSFIERLNQNNDRDVFVIIDPDANETSLKKSYEITGNVTRLLPTVPTDCNRAQREGKLKEWTDSLEVVKADKPEPVGGGDCGFTVMNAGEVMRFDDATKEAILDPILKTGEYVLMISPPGVGKSWVAFRMAIAAAMGARFIKWKFDRPVKTLYLDGEMGTADVKERLGLITDYNEKIKENLTIISPSSKGKASIPNISDPMGQDFYDKLIEDQKIELMVIDNYEYCSNHLDSSDSMFQEWDRVAPWITKHRANGMVIVLVDHTMVHDPLVQGVKGKNKLANTTIVLSKPTLELDHNGSHMKLEFSKSRNFYGDHGEDLYIKQEHISGRVDLTYKNYDKAVEDEVARLDGLGRSRGYIIERLKIPKYVYEDVTKGNKEDIVTSTTPTDDVNAIPFGDLM